MRICSFSAGYQNFTLYLLSKEPICVPMKLVLCLDCSFVSGVASFHELTNLWGNKRMRSGFYFNSLNWSMIVQNFQEKGLKVSTRSSKSSKILATWKGAFVKSSVNLVEL